MSKPMPASGLLSYLDEAVLALGEIPPHFQSVGELNCRIRRCRDVDGKIATERWEAREKLIADGMDHSSKVRLALTLMKQHLQNEA